MKKTNFPAVLIVSLALGCGGKVLDAEPGGRASPEAYCSGYSAAAARCAAMSVEAVAALKSECLEERSALIDKWSEAFGNAYLDCETAVACASISSMDETCLTAAIQAQNAGALPESAMTTCLSSDTQCADLVRDGALTSGGPISDCLRRWGACEAEGGYFGNEYCLTLVALGEAERQAATSCLSKGCAEIPACMSDYGAFEY